MLGSYAIHTAPQSLLQNLFAQIRALKGDDVNAQQDTSQEGFSASSLTNFSMTDYSNHLPKTCDFLCSHLSVNDFSSGEMITGELRDYFLDCNLGDVRVLDIGQRRDVDMALVARSFCQLLQIPFSLLSKQVG